jgi:hypothetical protein
MVGEGFNPLNRPLAKLMKAPDLAAQRREHFWRVEESTDCLFFINAAIEITSELHQFIEIASRKQLAIREVLEILVDETKDRERLRKVNIWVYTSGVLDEAGLINADKPNMFYGAASASGIHLVVKSLRWVDPMVIDFTTHESIHLWWATEVGEAPSLLNEGLAAYFERELAVDALARRNELPVTWQRDASITEPGFLRRLCRNEVFWAEDAAGKPAYELGGHFVGFLIQRYGLPKLRMIFEQSHFGDLELATKIEQVIGESLEELERQMTQA